MNSKRIQFFSNTPEDTHCYQAALKIVLKHFLPEKDFTFEKLDQLTAKKEGFWTWPTQGALNLHKMGFKIVDMDSFDINKFVENGENYLIEKYGKEVGIAQIKHSDIEQEINLYKKYLSLNIHKTVLPNINDVKNFIDKGYLVICNVNSHALNNKKGYTGHFVVVFGYDETSFQLHDPGLPAFPNRNVNYENFRKAWEYPDANSRNLLALKLT